MSRPPWARWVTRISLVAGLAGLAYMIHTLGLTALGKYFREIGWWWIAVVVFEVAITTLDAMAIRAFMSPESQAVRLRSALLSQLAGRSVNAVTPGGNLGEAVKVSVLTDYVSQSRAVSTILLYNVVSFAVELGMVAVAAPFLALLLPMPTGLRWLFIITSIVFSAISIGLYVLVHKGVLASVARLAVKLRLVSRARYLKWEEKLRSIDDKLRLVAGARRRDRVLGIALVALSRIVSLALSLVILHAIGEEITVAFVAGYTVGGFIVYMVASLVPMGLGVAEGGTYSLLVALGQPGNRGTALVLARRTTQVVYAAIGLVLVMASETVKRARTPRPPRGPAAVPADAAPVALPVPADDAAVQ